MSNNSIFKEHKKLMKLRDKYNNLVKEYDSDIKKKGKMLVKYEDKYDKYSNKINNIVKENKNIFDERFIESDKKRKNRKKIY